mgnify:CR=1 FL=1
MTSGSPDNQGAKPSVLFINRVFPPEHGTTGRLVRDLSLAFAKDGWHVNIICAGNTDNVERHKNNDIRVHKVKSPLKSKTALRYMKILWRLYKKGTRLPRHDLVISMTDPPMLAVAASRLAKRKKSAHIHWCQDLYPDLLPALGVKIPRMFMSFLKRMSCKALNSCDKVVVIGRDMAHYLVGEKIDPSLISVIPNWPNMELVRPAGGYHGSHRDQSDSTPGNRKSNRINGKQNYEIDIHSMKQGREPIINLFKDQNNPRFRVLYAGSISIAHPIETIMETAEILNKDHPEIEFVFVGDGPGFDTIAEQRAFRELANIRLIPFQPAHRLRELMESGDVHLISMDERCRGLLVPSKLYSALAAARPTIFLGPDKSEVATVLSDFKAGVITEQGNPQKLAKLIKYYRYNSEAWFTAQNGAAEAGQNFVPRQSLIAWLRRSRVVVKNHRVRTET